MTTLRFAVVALGAVAWLSGLACSSSSKSGSSTDSDASSATHADGSSGAHADASAHADGAACTFSPAAPKPPPAVDGGASIKAQVEAKELGVLDMIFGRYLRGDAPAYRGTIHAHDDYVLYNGPDGAVIPDSQGLASLVVASGQATLTLHSPSLHEYLMFQQSSADPALTTVGVILGDTSTGGDTATCTGCLPNLFHSPATIALNGLMTSPYDAGPIAENGPPITIYAGGSLSVVSPCTLSYADLIELALPDIYSRFVKQDGSPNMVWEVEGSIVTGPASGLCTPTEEYTIDLYVDPNNPADYSVGNYRGTAGEECAG